MQNRSRKIKKFVALAQSKERRAGELNGRSQAALNEQVDRLGELNAYRHSYVGAAADVSKIHAAHWQDYQNFLYRLDTAVRAQQQVIQGCEESVAAHRRQWMARRQRLESLERVMDRYQKQEHIEADRLEQRALDDLHSSPERYDKGGD